MNDHVPASLNTQNLQILVIDDTVENRDILSKSLGREGYSVLAAGDGPTGRALALAQHPDLVLLDINMPGETGLESIRKLKEDPRTRDIPVIFITALNETQLKVACFEYGAVDYIVKPFHLAEVRARIRRQLQLKSEANAKIVEQAEKLKQIRDAQASMLIQPSILPEAKFGVYYESLLEAGGDFYDVLQVDDHSFAYLVADVSGHDIATSFITAALNALLKQNCIPGHDPRESMCMINRVLREILPKSRYLTACYALLDRSAQTMTLVNMGHPPALYVPIEGESRLIEVKGEILGSFKNIHLESATVQVQPGDRFFLYSDGLLERTHLGHLWSELASELPEKEAYLRKPAAIEKSVNNLFHLCTMQYGDPDDDVVVMAIEV